MHRATRPATTRRIVAIPIVIAMLVAVACSSGKSSASGPGDHRHGGTLRLAVVASTVGKITGTAIDPTAIGPTDQDAMVLVDLTSDSLTSIDPATQLPVPALASSWSADSAGTSWTFTLRDDASFADGSPVTAADVSTSLERVASKAGQSLAGARLDVVSGYAAFVSGQDQHFSGISVKDDHTLVITTGAPDAELPLLLGSPLYGVVKLVSSSADGDSTSSTAAGSTATGSTPPPEVVGTGPFMIESGDDPLIHMTRSPGSKAAARHRRCPAAARTRPPR